MIKQAQILIYCNAQTNRFNYACHILFNEIYKIQVELTHSEQEFRNSKLAKISYSANRIIEDCFWICPNGLLKEKIRILKNDVPRSKNKDLTLLFSTTKGDLGFDIFSAIFYLCSRMEEYDCKDLDSHNRYKSKNSILHEIGFLQKPIIHYWAELFKISLANKYKSINFLSTSYRFEPSIDVDMAWSYKNKGWIRHIASTLKDIVNLNFKSIIERSKVLAGIIPDPFYSFEYLHKIFGTTTLKYFILFAQHGEFDKNISTKNKDFQKLIKSLDSQFEIGIHPSYASNDSSQILSNEKKDLENIIKQKIQFSRQHFLKLNLPNTYQRLIDQGIKEDYTMGYSDNIGFRAGISIPFPWYDLENEEITNLTIHPFQVMDVTLKNYLQLDPSAALKKVIDIIIETKKFNGTFGIIWHNSSIHQDWNSWQPVLESIITEANCE